MRHPWERTGQVIQHSLDTYTSEKTSRQSVNASATSVLPANSFGLSSGSFRPLPSPDILVQHNHAVPGAAERILALTTHEFVHLQSRGTMRLSASYLERRLGQIFGFSRALIALSASVFLASTGHETTASVNGGVTLVSLVSIFVVGRLSRTSTPTHECVLAPPNLINS